MKLNNCPICERHVRPDEPHCPFCGAGLELQPATPSRAVLVVALGLALAACGDDKSSETTMGSGSMSAGTMTTTADTETASETEIGSSDTSSSDPTFNTSGNDYAGPGVTSLETTSGGSTTTDTATDTDSSSSTSDATTDSGGQDYAGAAVDPDREALPE